ncbi:hypothetical protein T459_32776 [Capsicum annuum]|uniref:Pentatricopeptide repeat-containing protein At1g80270, mitochondrial-like n=1 Tax=Capsicum annuum TaxID=4072 RepID=A0A2G2Y0Z9_CAPAN|nr:putative F-box protein-like isoform X1 [Capsicum annuum]PHT63412.1 hypothetical protein T459_32776 [Capsicum annuum]
MSMWTLRRSSSLLKKKGFISRSSRISCTTNEVTGRYSEGHSEDNSNEISNRYLSFRGFFRTAHGSSKLFLGCQNFSSLVGTKSGIEIDSDLDDGFSELEGPTVTGGMLETNVETELFVDDVDGEDVEMPHDKLELSDSESDARKAQVPEELLKAITTAPVRSLNKVMVNWVEKGNDLTRADITIIMFYLCKRHMYWRALQFSEWLELKKQLIFTDRDYASHVDLIAKVHSVQKAESYIEKLPKSFRSEAVYRSLLGHCASKGYTKKAEEIFNKMRDLGFPVTSFACGHLLTLYKQTDKKKIADVLLLMEKENIQPTEFTYRIPLKKADDVRRIWQLCEPNAWIVECMAAIEAFGNLHKIEEAEAVFDKMSKEGKNITSKHYYPLLRIYASHNMFAKGKDLVKRIFVKPKVVSYFAMMEEYSKRGDVHNSEKIFYQMRQAGYVCRIRQFQLLIQAYINAKAPCYGIAERMKADDVFPNRTLANMLSKSDPFRKTETSELLLY